MGSAGIYRVQQRGDSMAQIGRPQREIYVEPLEIPVPQREPKTVATPAPQPVGVPA